MKKRDPKPLGIWNIRTSSGDIPINIVSNEEAEQADFVVCCTVDMPSEQPEWRKTYGSCAMCGTGIYWNWTSAPKRPPKICIQCASERAKHGDPH